MELAADGTPASSADAGAASGAAGVLPLTRRRALAALGGGAAVIALLGADGSPLVSASPGLAGGLAPAVGYAPDGTAGLRASLGLSRTALLPSAFLDNSLRNTAYLLFLDPERLLRSFRVNYGQPSTAQPCGGWEDPESQVRGHTTGHLLSALAMTYANTGNSDALERGQYLVAQLAVLQARAQAAGFSPGYLSAFPESYFDRLEAGQVIWSPYYMIHKYLAGLIDQYQLAGDDAALEVATRLADWVCWRTGRLPYSQMQMVLETEFGGLPEALANLYAITGAERYLAAAQRFYHARVLDPLAAGTDALAGLHANTTVPKIISCLRMWEETGSVAYRDIAVNFWDMVTRHHTYVIGGASNHEHFQAPDAVASQLSNYTCENCVSYNMLKLTRLLLFHQPWRTDLADYYERVLFNQMLGEQDPASPHGFNCYYTGLSAGARKQQPLNYFPHGNPAVYATDYDTFTCDTATGMETAAKFADTIYTRDAEGLYVNLFIPSVVRAFGLVLRLDTDFPDAPLVTLSVRSGTGPAMALRVRVPGWTAGVPAVALNGRPLRGAVSGGWVSVRRRWLPGDTLAVTLPMGLGFSAAPDDPSVQAVTYGPVVLAGGYRGSPGPALPVLDVGSLRQAPGKPIAFTALADGKPVTLSPIARTAHDFYTVYWRV